MCPDVPVVQQERFDAPGRPELLEKRPEAVLCLPVSGHSVPKNLNLAIHGA